MYLSSVAFDEVGFDVNVSNGLVSDFAQDVKACALGQASAAILAKNVRGCSLDELETARAQLGAMLKDDGPPPNGKFSELQFLFLRELQF